MLVLLLRVGGGLACTAVFAIFLPTAWMAAIHRWLGLGEFPDASLTQYLTRSVSAFYAVFGGLAILASRDVRRFGPVITYLAIATMAFGVVITGVLIAPRRERAGPLWRQRLDADRRPADGPALLDDGARSTLL